MFSKFTAIFLLGVLTSGLCFPRNITRSADENVQDLSVVDAQPSVSGVAEPALADATSEQKPPGSEDDKFLFPLITFNAAVLPNNPPPPRPPLPAQTIVIPPGSEVSVNAGQAPLTISRPGSTVVTQG